MLSVGRQNGDYARSGGPMKHALFAAMVALVALVSPSAAQASLRIVQVNKGDAVSKDLGLTVLISPDVHYPEVPIVTVTARADSPLRTLFGSGLRVGEERHRQVIALLLDIPVEFTRPYRTSDLRLRFRLEENMLRSATLYLRTGTAYSEVQYTIRLVDYMARGVK